MVWYLRLIGDTEGPTLIASTACSFDLLSNDLLGTPATSLTAVAIETKQGTGGSSGVEFLMKSHVTVFTEVALLLQVAHDTMELTTHMPLKAPPPAVLEF